MTFCDSLYCFDVPNFGYKEINDFPWVIWKKVIVDVYFSDDLFSWFRGYEKEALCGHCFLWECEDGYSGWADSWSGSIRSSFYLGATHQAEKK